MKTLRNYIIIAVFIIGGMAMSGCEESDASNSQQVVNTNEHSNSQAGEKSMDSKEKKDVLDSLNNVNNRVDELFAIIETQKSVIGKNQSNIDDIKKTSSISTLVSWTLAIISIILAILALIKAKSSNARAGRHREEIEKIKQSLMDLERNIANSARTKNTSISTLSSRDYSDLSFRISKLERLYTQMQSSSTSTTEITGGRNYIPNQPNIPSQPQIPIQHGYFGLPTQMSLTEAYFKRLSDVRDSDSRFTVEVRNDKAEFRPLEGTQYLNDLKSNDAIKMALEFEGCAPSEATQMKVILPGVAQKDGDRWIITKKATIGLYR